MAEVANLRPANAFVHVFDSSALPPNPRPHPHPTPSHARRFLRLVMVAARMARVQQRTDLKLDGRREGKGRWISNAERCKHITFPGNVRPAIRCGARTAAFITFPLQHHFADSEIAVKSNLKTPMNVTHRAIKVGVYICSPRRTFPHIPSLVPLALPLPCSLLHLFETNSSQRTARSPVRSTPCGLGKPQ